MNPNHWPINDWNVITYLYEEIYFNDGSLKPSVPWLAKSIEYLDPVTALMKLREGIRFHDGTPFNAESVKYQMDWIRDKKNGAWSSAWLRPIKSLEVVDEYTVKWNFDKPWAAFIGTIANAPAYMMSTKALKGDVAPAAGQGDCSQTEKRQKEGGQGRRQGKKEGGRTGSGIQSTDPLHPRGREPGHPPDRNRSVHAGTGQPRQLHQAEKKSGLVVRSGHRPTGHALILTARSYMSSRTRRFSSPISGPAKSMKSNWTSPSTPWSKTTGTSTSTPTPVRTPG